MNAKARQPGLIPQRDAQAEAIAGPTSNQLAANAKSELSLFSDFLSRLDDFAPNDEVPDQTRINIVMVLGIIIEGLEPFLQHKVGRLDTGEDAVTDHTSIVFLKRLLNTIKDLDAGKTHPAWKKNPKGKTASLPRNDQASRDAWLELVDIVKLAHPFKTRREAEVDIEQGVREVEAKKRASGEKKTEYPDSPITAELLKSWRDRRAAKEVK